MTTENISRAYSDYGNYNLPSKTNKLGSQKQSSRADQLSGSEKVSRDPDKTKKAGRRSTPEECQTCKNRKYKDGSNEGNVSFKAAAHISPEAAGARVRAHEGEHVANANKKAAARNGQVMYATVTIQTSICPECGRTYVSGGVTKTSIRFQPEDHPYGEKQKEKDQPYGKNQKAIEAIKSNGSIINYAA